MKIFVPIKKNSQRVPGKNYRIISGKHLYERLIDKLSDFEVFVDTDCRDLIQELNNKYDYVNAYMRHPSLVGDTVSTCDLIFNFLQKFSIKDEWICQIHVTSPFLEKSTLKKVAELTKQNIEVDSIVSCNVHQSRFWRSEEYGFCPINHNPTDLQQTQDLPKYYEENSLFYAFRSSDFINSKTRIGKRPYFYETNFPENIDIDTEEDWSLVVKIAEPN